MNYFMTKVNENILLWQDILQKDKIPWESNFQVPDLLELNEMYSIFYNTREDKHIIFCYVRNAFFFQVYSKEDL